jgi:hypothetical protein
MDISESSAKRHILLPVTYRRISIQYMKKEFGKEWLHVVIQTYGSQRRPCHVSKWPQARVGKTGAIETVKLAMKISLLK